MNILINSYCNLTCPYCFANTTMKECNNKNMDINDFRFVLNFLRNNGIRSVRLIGGEPTLSPNLELFINTVIRYKCFDDILIFSNFTFDEQICNMLIEKNNYIRIETLPNINEFELLPSKYKYNITRNLEEFYKNGMLNTIGINIYRPDMKLDQWENLIKKYKDKLKAVRYSIAVPSSDVLKNNFDFYSYYNQFEPILWKLISFIEKYNIPINGDCNNLPTCCYSPELIGMITRYCPKMIGVSNNLSCGFPIVDIQPDLEIKCCFGYSIPENRKMYLRSFSSEQEIYKWLNGMSNNSEYIARKECLNCPRYKMFEKRSCACKSTHLVKRDDYKNDVFDI